MDAVGTTRRMKGQPEGFRDLQKDSAGVKDASSDGRVVNEFDFGKAPRVCFAALYILAGDESDDAPWSVT